MNKETAAAVITVMIEFGDRLDETVRLVRDTCDQEEFERYRRVVGRIMGSMLLDVMNPVFKEYPELKPDGLD